MTTAAKTKSKIEKILYFQCIENNEEVTRDNVMNKRDAIIQKHVSEVYPILSIEKGGKNYYYTKLTPEVRGHEHKISALTIDDLHDKIVAFYLDIEIREKTKVADVLEMAVMDLNPLTATRHRQIFNKHFSILSTKKIAELSENDIRICLQAMLDSGIKAKSFNNATSTLNKINDFCVYNHIPCINIREKIAEFRKIKMVGKKVFVTDHKSESELSFTEPEAVELIKYAINQPDYLNLGIAALITTGLRAGELLALKSSDIDLQAGIMRVDKMENTHTMEIIDSCKDHSERTVFLNGDALMIFEKILELRNLDDSNSEFLFLNECSADGKMHLRALDNRLRKNQHVLRLTDRTAERSPHDCRRTYASIQYLHGVDIKTIQAQLGHSRAEQTWEYIRDIVDAETRSEKLQRGCILNF